MNRFFKASPSRSSQRGQGLLEYIVLTALVAIVCLGTVKTLGSKVKHHLTRASNTFDRTMRQGLSNRSANTSTASDDNEGGEGDSPLAAPRQPRGARGLPWPF